MNYRQMIGLAGVMILALVVLVEPATAQDETMNISGTILTLDRDANTIVLAEIGPWRVRGGVTQISRRTIAVNAATEFMQIRRADDTGLTGWIGDFVETGIRAWAVKEGDFVTARVRKEDERLTALTVALVAP